MVQPNLRICLAVSQTLMLLKHPFSARAGPRQAPLKNSQRVFDRTDPETSTAI